MKATNIRSTKGHKLSNNELKTLCDNIRLKTGKAGFITNAEIVNGGSIKIGLHMSSFRIDTAKLGYNARIGKFIDSPKGYKRTDVPTWEQREDFNHLINNIFDKFKLTARIVSGPYQVRDRKDGRVNEWEPLNYDGSPGPYGVAGAKYNGMGEIITQLMTESDAREHCDSDRLEAEHAEKMRPIRLERARQYRAKRKALEEATYIIIGGIGSWSKNAKYNGKTLTQKQYQALLTKLDNYDRRMIHAEPVNQGLTREKPAKLRLVGAV